MQRALSKSNRGVRTRAQSGVLISDICDVLQQTIAQSMLLEFCTDKAVQLALIVIPGHLRVCRPTDIAYLRTDKLFAQPQTQSAPVVRKQ